MSDRDIMLKVLNDTVIKDLKAQGFKGSYPHFKRIKDDCIELIDFQANKYGGSFTVELSAVFPDSRVTNLSNSTEVIDVNKVDVACTNERYRLKGMFDGWFYYSDVYRMPQGFYHNVLEKERDTFKPTEEWTLLQAFDELVAEEICEEISLQLDDAFDWLYKLERKNRKFEVKREDCSLTEEKAIDKRTFGFFATFIICFPVGLFSFCFDKAIGGLILVIAIMSLAIMFMTPTSYIFSQERVVIKYFFGLEESIMWTSVLSVRKSLEVSKRLYITREYYDFCYLEERKKHFFMNGEITKTKKTTELMKKYCPKRID